MTREATVEIMRHRHANNRDLWNGKPLKKSDMDRPKRRPPGGRQRYRPNDDPHWKTDEARLEYEHRAVEAFYLMAFRTAYNKTFANERDHVLRFWKALVFSARRLPDTRDAILWYFLEGEPEDAHDA